jgi:transposase InsO family protein
MRNNSQDETLKRNYIQKYQYLIAEYEEVKAGKHPTFRLAKEFYAAHGTCAQTFLKYYNRWRQSGGADMSLLPGKRGPRYQTRRCPAELEALVLAERARGCNRYEIYAILKGRHIEPLPSPSTIYQILRRHGKNRLSTAMKEEKRSYVRAKAGELAHVDCYHLSRDTIASDSSRYYLLAVVDDATRIAWAEVMTDITALSAMFAALKSINEINQRYHIQFQEMLTDNGPEFGTKASASKDQHPFERLLAELGIKHRYTRPYRPQTNGKVERFWRTLHEDLIEGTYFSSIGHFREELFKYILYYNHLRPHQALDGKTPNDFNQIHQRIV